MSSELPSEYRYSLTTEEFVFAITANDESFAQRADEMREKGVERLTGYQISRKHKETTISAWESLYTYIHEARLDDFSITLTNINRPIPSLFIFKSQIPDVLIDNCQLGQFEDVKHILDVTNFYIIFSKTRSFRIKQSTIGDFEIDQSTIRYFSIAQSTTEDFKIHRSTTKEFGIYESTTEDFRIHRSTTEEFEIYESTIGYFEISQSMTGGVKISRSKTGDFGIYVSKTAEFEIRQSTTGYFRIQKQSTTGEFEIAQSTTGDFKIANSTVDNFTGSDLYSSMFLQKTTIAEIRLTNCHIPSIIVRSGCKAEMYITDSAINLIDLRHLTLSKESVLSLFNCSIYACLMEELTVLGNLFFRQSQVLSKPFPWYNPIERIGNKPDYEENESVSVYNTAIALLNNNAEAYERYLIRLTTNEIDDYYESKALAITAPTFRIAQSSLGKTEFTDCDLGGFRFEYNSAKITEVFMSGGTVPEAGIVIYNATSENGEESDILKREEQKVSVYNQLKKIFEGQGDIYWATHFQSKTAEHQTEVLKIRIKSEKGRPGTTLWDLLTLRLNGISNNHGESWGRALLFTFVGGLVAYTAYLWFIGRLFHMDSQIDWDLVGQYFSFLDPTHKDDFIKDAEQGFWSRLVHFLGRIWVGYGIFQFISAFRKHGKK